MPPLPTLDTLTVAPSIVVVVEGRSYRFSELSMAALGRLQSVIKRIKPHPLDAVRPHLDGLPADIQARLIERALESAGDWPPRVGSAEGLHVLLHDPDGLVAALHEGLAASYPEATTDDAYRIMLALQRDAKARAGAEDKVERIFGCLFGSGPDGVPAPKA